jgi:ATP-dependent Clp endopeptidase proteolytic subunit ClpP
VLVFNKKANKRGEVLIYEEIGENFWTGEGVTAKRFAAGLKELGNVEELDVRINSPGGTVFDGLAIYNQLKQHKATVNVFIDGVALSMASGIAMAGDRVHMARNGLLMLHNPQAIAIGDEDDLTRTLKMLATTKDSLAVAYADKSGKSADEIKNIMGDETWMAASEAKEAGFVDEITDEVADVAACILPMSLKVPVAHAAAINSFVRDLKMAKANTTAESAQPQTTEAPVIATAPTAPPANTAPARVPATLAELKALNGATSEFVLEQLEAQATPTEAVNALNASLASQLEEAREAKPAPSAPANLKPAHTEAGAIGVKPLRNDQATEAMGMSPQDFHEHKQMINSEMRKIQAREGRNFKASEAIKEVRHMHPELFPPPRRV